MAYDPRGTSGWLIHDPEAIHGYRRALMDERPEQILANLRKALQGELASIWSGEAAQGYLEEAERRLELFRRWLEERRQLDEQVAAGESVIDEAVADVERMLRALGDLAF